MVLWYITIKGSWSGVLLGVSVDSLECQKCCFSATLAHGGEHLGQLIHIVNFIHAVPSESKDVTILVAVIAQLYL